MQIGDNSQGTGRADSRLKGGAKAGARGLRTLSAALAAFPADLQARWENAVMRKPGLAYPGLRRGIDHHDEPSFQVLLGAFFILERWGRGPEMQRDLEQALARATRLRLLEEAAELSEALGRLHYQRGDYVQACNAWSQTLELADDETRWACLARIGLAHLCFALGDWARGGRVLDQAEVHYPRLADDAYLRAKIALNRAVSLRATQGPQAALPRLDEAQAAARSAGHRDYEAEAIWHHARCARDSGATAEALMLAARAEDLARRCHYRWLQAQALLLLSELSQDSDAINPAEQALGLGEDLQSRSVQAAAHGRLSQLRAELGELGPSWYHQQQRQRLEATLGQTELPARLEQLARFDTDPHGADALLLTLGRSEIQVATLADVDRQWQEWRGRLMEALSLSDLDVRWTGPDAPAARDGRETAGTAQSLQELELRAPDGSVAGVLRLARGPGAEWSRADHGRAGRLAALLQRLLAQAAQGGMGVRAVLRPPAEALSIPPSAADEARDLLRALESLAAAPRPANWPQALQPLIDRARRLSGRLP